MRQTFSILIFCSSPKRQQKTIKYFLCVNFFDAFIKIVFLLAHLRTAIGASLIKYTYVPRSHVTIQQLLKLRGDNGLILYVTISSSQLATNLCPVDCVNGLRVTCLTRSESQYSSFFQH